MVKNNISYRRKNRLERFSRAFFVVLSICIGILVVLMCIPSISAQLDFDNTYSFDDKIGNYGKVTIKDWFGLLDLSELEVKENSDVCNIDCSSETEIIMHQDGVLIDDVRFMLLKNKETWIKSRVHEYYFYILDGEKKTIYNLGDEVEKGTYTIRLEAKKGAFDTIDWQITSQGFLIDEWLSWTSGLNDDLLAYYNFDADKLNQVNSSTLNLTDNEGSPEIISENCVLNSCVNISDADNNLKALAHNTYDMFKPNKSVSWWYNPHDDGLGGIYIFQTAVTEWQVRNQADKVQVLTIASPTIVTHSEWDVWTHYVITTNDTHVVLYKNATRVGSSSRATNDGGRLFIGSDAGGGSGTVAKFDEMGWWNRTLTSGDCLNGTGCGGEVGILFNNGTGVTYTGLANLEVDLSTPANDSTASIINVNFVANYSSSQMTLINGTYYIRFNNGTLKNETTKTIPSTNTTTLTVYDLIPAKYIWNVKVCASNTTGVSCKYGENNWTLTYRDFNITSETYVNSTISGIINPFILNLETNGFQATVAYLIYNKTSYLGSINSTGNFYTLTKNKIAPGVSTETNLSFQWNVTMSDGTNYLAALKNQSVSPIVINQTCVNMNTIFNFTLVDEITQAKIDASPKNTSIKVDLNLYTSDRNLKLLDFYHTFTATNPAAICIDNNLSGGKTYSLDMQVQYLADDYSNEFYNVERYVLNSAALNNNITLYDLATTNTQKFKLIIRDTSYLPIDGALVRIERKYLENGTFYVTEIPKTDEKGITSASLQVNDVIYNFYIYSAGILISSFTNVLAICQTPLVSQCEIDFNAFQSEIPVIDYETADDFNFTLGYNSTSKVITSQFLVLSGEPSLVELVVTSEDTLGTSVCSDSLTSSSGLLSCIVPSSFGNSSVIAKLYKDGAEIGKGSIKLDQKSSDIYGVVLVMISVLVMMTLIGIGVSDNPVVTAVFIFVGVVLMFAINLIQNTGFIGATATILFFAIATILVIIKASRRS